MIASYGGAIIDGKGNRVFPGSGGMVGGLSEPGKNYGYILGAGSQYNSFTPRDNRDPRDPCEINPDNCGGGGGGPICPGDPGCPPIDPPPIDPPTCPGDPGCPPIHPSDPTCPGDPSCPPDVLPDVLPGGVGGIIQRLLGATPLNNSGPVYLFTPQPGEAAAGGVDMKNLAIIAVIGLIAWFAYSKLS